MKQILQNLKTGATSVEEIPCPRASVGQLLIRTARSLISAGTERMLVDFGKANPIETARQQASASNSKVKRLPGRAQGTAT